MTVKSMEKHGVCTDRNTWLCWFKPSDLAVLIPKYNCPSGFSGETVMVLNSIRE